MEGFTLDDLRRILRTCAGEDETTDLEGDIENRTFPEMGYDSLALLALVGKIERERSISVPDGVAIALASPREVIDYVNSLIATVA